MLGEHSSHETNEFGALMHRKPARIASEQDLGRRRSARTTSEAHALCTVPTWSNRESHVAKSGE